MESVNHQNPSRTGRPGVVRPRGVALAMRGRGTTVRAWAIEHGFAIQSVYVVIERWIDHPDRRGRMPRGGISRDIARALNAELGAEIVPLESAG